MPLIFQNIQHLFLELFCAEVALKIRYVYHSRNVGHDYVYHSRTVGHDYVYHSRTVTSMANERRDLHCLSLRNDAKTQGLMAHNVTDDTPAMIHQSPNPTLLLH
jgi:hypothetical protein